MSRTDRRITDPGQLDELRFDANGLLPVVTQDARNGRVLMLAWANREAIEHTLSTGEMHYWSRSRSELWHKGATSGNTQRLHSLHTDCDGDALLALVIPAGPACHTGEVNCFGGVSDPGEPGRGDSDRVGILDRLWETLEERKRDLPEGSYTAKLLTDENLRTKKLGEETAELILALARREGDRIPEEVADLLYHTLVALLAAGGSWSEVEAVLRERHTGG